MRFHINYFVDECVFIYKSFLIHIIQFVITFLCVFIFWTFIMRFLLWWFKICDNFRQKFWKHNATYDNFKRRFYIRSRTKLNENFWSIVNWLWFRFLCLLTEILLDIIQYTLIDRLTLIKKTYVFYRRTYWNHRFQLSFNVCCHW